MYIVLQEPYKTGDVFSPGLFLVIFSINLLVNFVLS